MTPLLPPARWRGGHHCFSSLLCMAANHQLAGSATLLCADSSWTETRRRIHPSILGGRGSKALDRAISAWIEARAESRRDFSSMSSFQINRSSLEKKSLSDRHQSLKRSTGSPTIPAWQPQACLANFSFSLIWHSAILRASSSAPLVADNKVAQLEGVALSQLEKSLHDGLLLH